MTPLKGQPLYVSIPERDFRHRCSVVLRHQLRRRRGAERNSSKCRAKGRSGLAIVAECAIAIAISRVERVEQCRAQRVVGHVSVNLRPSDWHLQQISAPLC